MKSVTSVSEVRTEVSLARKRGVLVGFVPTMGCLHEGHLSLIRLARKTCPFVIVSIFVNPSQFGPSEDFEAYPRDLERDERLCRLAGVDVVFCPNADVIYPRPQSVYVDESELSTGLCGSLRPGHFRGVLTVVAKLFNLVQPDVAVFGGKDAQQARLISQMVDNLYFAVEVVVAPTVREGDGLAMSSRNRYLSGDERGRALSIWRALSWAKVQYAEGVVDTGDLLSGMRSILKDSLDIVEYVEIVDYDSFSPVLEVAGRTLVAIAGRVGKTRLIDNVIIGSLP